MTALRRGARRLLERHVGGTAVVLIYHRVAKLQSDPQLLAVSPEHFDAQMQLIDEEYQPISLDELAAGLARRSVPNRAVAVTFDDGYADNLANAEPILAARGVPATVFVSSGYVASDREFWWDELEQILLSPGVLSGRPRYQHGLVRLLGRARGRSNLLRARCRRPARLERPGRTTRTHARVPTWRWPKRFVLCLRIRESRCSTALHAAAGTSPVVRPSHRPMTALEVAQLDSSTVVDIGGHTVSHLLLARHPAHEQRAEIVDDRAALSKVCARPISAFSYPYGGLEDYSDDSVRLAREAGYEYACSNHPGVVKPWTDPYRLPRHIVRDWPAEEFSQRLRSWFDGTR